MKYLLMIEIKMRISKYYVGVKIVIICCIFISIDPSRLHEEMTRYHVYLQVKKDLAEGRLAGAPFSTICLLTSHAAQVK